MGYGSENMVLRTSKRHWQLAYTADVTNKTDTAFSSYNATNMLTATGKVDTTGSNLAKVMVYSDVKNKTLFSLMAGYSQVSNSESSLWIPSFICRVKWTWDTNAACAGLASEAIDNTRFFADAVELVDGDTSIRLITDTDKNSASVTVDMEGATYLQILFDESGATPPDNYNAVVGLI